jgi:Phosphoinositide phospholipase C, Ca2+-dependent
VLRPVLLLATLAALLAAAVPAASARSRDGDVRLNEIQAIGTHNSYKRETTEAEQQTYDQLISTPGDYDAFLEYSHPRLANQLARQDIRGLEIDLFGDPQGGLYANPLVRQRMGLGPLTDPAWQAPGIKVLHIADFDYATTCVAFVACLQQVKAWSDANPRHAPLPIMLELKQSDRRAVEQGGVVAPPWDVAALDALDAEIRSVFGPRDIVEPDDVRHGRLTLEDSVLRRGWPRLSEARGQVLFLLDNEPGPIRDAYRAGRPNLEGRPIFTNARPGEADAAFLKRNEPRGANTALIQDLVRRGYYVRTRSDVPLATVTANDPAMLQAALSSGAQLISTDFAEIGMSARYDSDFIAEMPDGGTLRCNPVNAPRWCADDRIERIRSR